MSEVFASTDARRACPRSVIGSTVGAYPRGTGSNPVKGNGHFSSLMLSALSFVFLWHTHTHTRARTHTHTRKRNQKWNCPYDVKSSESMKHKNEKLLILQVQQLFENAPPVARLVSTVLGWVSFHFKSEVCRTEEVHRQRHSRKLNSDLRFLFPFMYSGVCKREAKYFLL